MDNPGHSIFAGGSLHLEGITANNEEEDLQREEEEEEENRRREQEIQDLLVNAFDDLEDEESYSHHSGYPHTTAGVVCNGGGVDGDGGRKDIGDEGGGGGDGLDPALSVSYYPPYSHSQDVHSSYQEYQSDMLSHNQDGHHQEDKFGDVPKGVRSLEDLSHRSSSSSVAPWSEDSRGTSPTMFNPLQSHETARNDLGDGTVAADPYDREYRSVDNQGYGVSSMEAGSFHSLYNEKQGNQDMQVLNDQYKEAETSYAQLKLLYEARGRELDRQMADYSKLQFESNRDIRAIQHQLSLMRSENEGKLASVKQLQILLLEKEERVKALVVDMKDLQIKFSAQQDENKKLHLELETAESTISSLECQVSELKAVDSLSKNQKLQEEFIRKLQQGNQEDKAMLLSKLQESQKEAQASQQEVKRLREELKSMRNMYDGAVMQKTETVTKLNLTIETLRKQHEQLLEAHDSQEILKLELKLKSLEASNQNLEEQVSMLDIELKKAKEDLQSYDMAMKLGVMKELIPEEDSMDVLGIKKTLNYDTAVMDSGERGDKKLPDGDEGLRISEELKKSLIINKAKRKEIAMLRDDIQEKQAKIRKAASDLRNANAEIKQLKEQILKLELEKDERDLVEGRKETTVDPSTEREEENSSLRQEVAHQMACVREIKQLYTILREAVATLKNTMNENLANFSQEQLVIIISKVDEVLSLVENGRKLSAEVECLHELLTEMRKENSVLHQAQALWEKRLGSFEVKAKVLEKMIRRVVTDPERANEIKPSLATLQQLLSDLQEVMTAVKSEVAEAQQERLTTEDKLSNCQMEKEKAKDRVAYLEQEISKFEAQAADLERQKNMEKKAELESYQRNYLKFHEEAMHELEAKVKVEYERIVTELKEKILELARDVQEAKDCYIQVCQEKTQLEERLGHLLENRVMFQESQRLQQGTRTTLSTPDSGISGEAVDLLRSQQAQVAARQKEIEALKDELVSIKEQYKEQSKKLEMQEEQFNIKVRQLSKEADNVTTEKGNNSARKLEETCNKLEKVNQKLQDQCQDQEAEIRRLKEALSEETASEDKAAWKAILERQQKRMNEEKEELRTHFRKVIEELQNKYKQVERSQLLEDRVREQDSSIKRMNKRIKELENAVETTNIELKKVRNDLNMQEEERESEVQKLTDMIQSREDELREKQEQVEAVRLGFMEYIKRVQGEHEELRDKLKKLEADLKEKERKYIHLRVKLKQFNEVKHQKKFYKDELNRLSEEITAAKTTIIERTEGYVEELKGVFLKHVEVVKESLMRVVDGAKQVEVAEALLKLGQLISYVKNFKFVIQYDRLSEENSD